MTSRVLMVRDSAGTTLDKRELAPDEFVAPFTIGARDPRSNPVPCEQSMKLPKQRRPVW